MNHTPSTLSHSPTLSSLHHHPIHFHRHSHTAFNSGPSSSFLYSASLAIIPFATRSLVLKLFRHFRCAHLLRVHCRLIVLFFLPSLYFITSSRRSFALDFLSVIAFSAALLISLNIALPRFVSTRLFLSRSLPIKLCSSSCVSKPAQPVLWSIGSKPKLDKKPNSGSWVQVYSNKDVYEGEFDKGKCSGSGVYYYHMSGRYEGDWVDEKYDGYGVETWARGSRYRGQYRHGLRHGIGVYRFFTGDVYAGEWSNGQCHGCGIHTCEDGSRYVGEFKWGVKHGLGHYQFRNGDTYAGEYFADKMHGFGVYQFGNGHRYEGAWHEGRKQGLGMYTFRNGETQSGHWQNGVLDIPSAQNTQPGSSYSANHAKVLNAVQEAQRAAERAYAVAKVEERVNRAVAIANKAAIAARVAAVKAVQKQVHPL
ncbi:uncharacterized protein LOC125475250 [Pyrus x bretschneideri]|uniref:uncharacterized protein LOC125475250 n=1 Tax=Pyrus x bretschneideri TaxID=225117 RepID=UPI00202F279B|nr:uncharacterized protein LOC125475250 [Pyrus x bretschneideri]